MYLPGEIIMEDEMKHGNSRKQNVARFPEIQGAKPWLDLKGKRLPNSILKLFARSWNAETWDAYLDSFEEPGKEKHLSPKMWADIEKKKSDGVFDLAQRAPELELQDEVETSVKILPAFHRQVVRMTYWHNMSVRAIAKALGLPKSTVFDMIADAQRTLRALLKIEGGHFALNEGTNNFKKERSNDQDISA